MANIEIVTTRSAGQQILESVLGLAGAKDASKAVNIWRGQGV
jgi:hypothetical protein